MENGSKGENTHKQKTYPYSLSGENACYLGESMILQWGTDFLQWLAGIYFEKHQFEINGNHGWSASVWQFSSPPNRTSNHLIIMVINWELDNTNHEYEFITTKH